MKDVVDNYEVLKKVYDPSDFRKLGHQVIDLLADHLEKVQSDIEQPVLKYKTPTDELKYWQEDFSSSDSEMLDFFKNIIAHSTHVHHPRCMGHQLAVPSFIAALSGLVSDLLSNGTGVYEMGMASNALEKIVTDFVAGYIGYDEHASGFLTSGGTLANLTALLAARKAKAPNAVWENGHQEKLAVMVSEEAHYCIDRAARILGFGSEGIIKVPVNNSFQIETTLLETYLQKAKAKDIRVIAVIGCASSTATGSYDDLNALADFADKNDLWFHVDGAHGGGVAFSKQYSYLVKGINRADSVVIDFHKMLMIPALNTALVFKHGENSYKTFQQKAQYLWDSQHSQEWYNSGKRTFECTKLMMSVKVYSVIKMYGKDIFEKNIDRLYGLAKTFAAILLEQTDFDLAITPQSNIINFRFIGSKAGLEEINLLNATIRDTLIESGAFYIVQTMIGGRRYLRTTIMNPMTTETDFITLLDRIKDIVSELKKGYR
ncbi:aminotransferase class I/II-fold pyridoxal phosphate-dependent enzyme [Aquimarina sp. RZ0]|uniref:pyridoxal phosphate-dependent decarboxylase family protein n=1 Tax=Aquimarina sp. RZ0 TaxID=2607730 RepID=UPI0011F144B7|nr:aminotransferase class I/II-fold pyridoxal phosphate-dependent enzyme [Aquimarina sp. RZ0]KAA1246387.1 aminotransferase class I/II-fold pyridoxal phosphate-dependent enzyme [Aquimarina sp. RZ0]